MSELKNLAVSIGMTVAGWAGLLAKSQADLNQDLDTILKFLLIISTLIGIAAGLRAWFFPRKK